MPDHVDLEYDPLPGQTQGAIVNRYRSLTIASTAIAVLLLAGCTPPGPAEPAPTVTIYETAAPAGPAADYGFTFFEQAQLGTGWTEMSAALHYPVAGIEDCPWYGALWNSEITSTYAFLDSRDASGGSTFFYTNRLLAADDASFPRNAEGVGVGSTQAQILAAYPDAVVGSFDDLGAGTIATITVDDPDSDSKYVFGISDGSAVVDLLQWGPAAGTQWSHLCTGF